MNFSIDLRLFFPLLLNLIIFFPLLNPHEEEDGKCDRDVVIMQILQYPVVFTFLFILALLLLLLFLFTPILLPLSLNTSSPIITHSRDFPILLSLLILTSTILQPYRFWMTYLFLIGISPWFAELWSLFQRFLSRFHHTLRTHVPIIYITCVNQNQEMHPDEEIEMQDVQGDELHFEQRNCLEVVIDG